MRRIFRVVGLFGVVSISLSMLALLPCWAQDLSICDFLNPDSPFYPEFCREGGTLGPGADVNIGAPGRTSTLTMQTLVLPTVQPKPETEVDVGRLPNNVGSQLRYEHISIDRERVQDEKANIYGATLGWAMDRGNTTFGILVPYDFMDFYHSPIRNINQFGGILYGKHRIPAANDLFTFGLVGNGSYMYANASMEDGLSDDDVNTIGFGAGGSVTMNTDPVVPSVGVSYNYSHDDGETGDYHLIKVGGNVGLVLHPQFVVTPYAIWTSDQTDYEEGDADDYFDTGVEMAYRLDTGWQFSLGYKKVVDLDNFDSDQVYLGALWKF